MNNERGIKKSSFPSPTLKKIQYNSVLWSRQYFYLTKIVVTSVFKNGSRGSRHMSILSFFKKNYLHAQSDMTSQQPLVVLLQDGMKEEKMELEREGKSLKH